MEELKLRRQWDSEYETQLSDLYSTIQRLQSEFETEKERVFKTCEEAAIVESLDHEKSLLESEKAKCEDYLRRLAWTEDILRQKCDALAVENARIEHQAADLEQEVDRLSQLESNRAASLGKLLQESRFDTRQPEQKATTSAHRDVPNSSAKRSHSIVRTGSDDARTRSIESENEAIRLSEAACKQLDKACSMNPPAFDAFGKMQVRALREDISKARSDYLMLLNQVGTWHVC